VIFHPQKDQSISVMLPYKRIVFVDIPDPDNFFMVLHILKSYPDERVAVVLNTRVLDLSVTRYDHEFGDIKNEFGMEQMAFPFEKDGFPESVPDDLAHFFRRDAGLEDKEVREDTRTSLSSSDCSDELAFLVLMV
jgi:hypothetical protein